ncbi:MAG: tyrosine-type recombinase/integrase [Nocardioidaceae bacterium]
MAGKAGHRGFGHLRRLPSGRWQASYVGPDLARHNAPTTFEAKEDGEEWLAARRREITGDDWQPPKARTTAILRAYADTWLNTRTTPKGQPLRRKTRVHYRYLLDSHVLPTFGDMPMMSITPAAVRGWYAGLAARPTARAHAYALLSSILKTAVEDGEITKNPCIIKGATKAKQQREVKPATLDELAVMTEAMPVRLRPLIPLSAWCALRFGEAAELRRRDIDVKIGVIRIRRAVVRAEREVYVDDPKSDAGSRDVHVPPHLIPMLRQHLRDHAQIGGDGLLFYAVRTGRQLPHSTLSYHFHKARTAADRPDLTAHALRHTGAVLAAQSGATLKELMARLGHSTPQMAMRYQHASDERDRELAQRLSDLAGQS